MNLPPRRFLAYFAVTLRLVEPVATAAQIDIPGPERSGLFGQTVVVLPNGNFVVRDSEYDAPGPIENVGAIYLYSAEGKLISRLTGSTKDDLIGGTLGGITVLPSGNFLVLSPNWDRGGVTNAGAVTWVNGLTGLDGVVSESNSLVGSRVEDRVGGSRPEILSKTGNAVILTQFWDNGAVADAGALTWINGDTGISGPVSSVNSIVGSTSGDFSSSRLSSNGTDFLLVCPAWDRGSTQNAGAAIRGSGTTGTSGVISQSNALVGTTRNDAVGITGTIVLPNGHFVLRSSEWNSGAITQAGAVTWISSTAGLTGPVGSGNSLVGTTQFDNIGSTAVTVVGDSNYVVVSRNFDDGPRSNVGAVTWRRGSSGTSGAVSSANSLIGSQASDSIGSGRIVPLTNGNYVVWSPNWRNVTAASAGAATWCRGSEPTTGVVTPSNSLVGTSPSDSFGDGVIALANGNYVVSWRGWDAGGLIDAGAVTWGSGATGVKGAVSTANSLTGDRANTLVGICTPLANGHYVVVSAGWSRGGMSNLGAVTWCDGTKATSAIVSDANSLVGSTAEDRIGSGQVLALSDGNYVVASPDWDREGTANAGAVTWCNGSGSTTGTILPANSLVGTSPQDRISASGLIELEGGSYIVSSPDWRNGSAQGAGAVTQCSSGGTTTGQVSPSNSLVGSLPGDAVGTVGFSSGVMLLGNGNYIVRSPRWDHGSKADAGALTWCDGNDPVVGELSVANSLVGIVTNYQLGFSNFNVTVRPDGSYSVLGNRSATLGDGSRGISGVISPLNSVVSGIATTSANSMTVDYDPNLKRLLVGRQAENIVSFWTSGPSLQVENSTGGILASGGVLPDFGTVNRGSAGLPVFINLRNTGSANLTGVRVTVPAGSNHSINFSGPSSIAPGEMIAFSVVFSPVEEGATQTILSIASDVAPGNPFQLVLTGNGTAPRVETVGTPVINRQTGLWELTVKVSNLTAIPLEGFRLTVGGLTEGISLKDATLSGSGGLPTVDVVTVIAGMASTSIKLQFHSRTRSLDGFTPVINFEPLPPNLDLGSDGSGFSVDRIVRIPAGIMLEFTAVAGRWYIVEYSNNSIEWKRTLAPIQAAANRVQWIDHGPPQTDSLPADQRSRFYRVREISAP
jgi:hypothetical protein